MPILPEYSYSLFSIQWIMVLLPSRCLSCLSCTQCEPILRQGFRLGQYCCRCKEGYYSLPVATEDQCTAFCLNKTGSNVEPFLNINKSNQMFCWFSCSHSGVLCDSIVNDGSQGCYPVMPVCVPCWPGCKRCQDGSPCWVQEDWQLRAVLLTVHGFFMALVLISMLRVYQCRRTRVSNPSLFPKPHERKNYHLNI